MILLTTFAKLLNSIKADASKYGILIIMALMVVCACGCTRNNYSPYYNLSTGKGLEVYCWEISDGEWRCGALSGTNRVKWADEIAYLQYELPCPLNEMNKILKAYSGVSIVVFVVDYMQDTSDTLVYKLSQDIPETYKFLYSELGLSVPEYL